MTLKVAYILHRFLLHPFQAYSICSKTERIKEVWEYTERFHCRKYFKGPGSQGRFWIFITVSNSSRYTVIQHTATYLLLISKTANQTDKEWRRSWISHDGRAFIDCKDLFESTGRITPRIREMPRSFGICKILKQNRIISFIKGVFQHHFLYGGSHPYNYCLQNKTFEHSRKPNPLCRNILYLHNAPDKHQAPEAKQ